VQAKPAAPEWYVSYAWGDDKTPEGRARHSAIEALRNEAKARNAILHIDKDVLGLGDSISAFMERIGGADRVFIILSEKYLKSPFCMFELSEIWRTSRQNNTRFLDRVRAIALPDATIFKALDRGKWAAHWKQEYEALDSLTKTHGGTILGVNDHRELMHMQRFYSQVPDILYEIANVVLPRSIEDLARWGFGDPPEDPT
jgi:internalin A